MDFTTYENGSPPNLGEVCELVRQAFEASPYGHNGESTLVQTLESNRQHASLFHIVASEDAKVLGQALFSIVSITSSGESSQGRAASAKAPLMGMALAPIAVASGRQGQGIGSRLLELGIQHLEEQQVPFVALIGDPAWYSKFQFEPASRFGIMHGFAGIPQKYLLIRLLTEASDIGFQSGDSEDTWRLSYDSAFGPQFTAV